MEDYREKIKSLVKQKGPSLPSDIYKEMQTNQLFASAMLSEMVDSGILKITYLKRSSSPYYYLEEQKESLQNLSKFLNDKDILAFNLIKEKLIVNDSEQIPLMRVALRAIKDFAIPVKVEHEGKIYFFWKWYLLAEKETEEKIKSCLGISFNETKKKELKELFETKDEKPAEILKQAPVQAQILSQTIKNEPKKEKQDKLNKEVSQTLEKKPIKKEKKSSKENAFFLEKTLNYFKKNNIKIISQEIINKSQTEIDFVIELPTPVGNLEYYCKAKSKKSVNDGDIASAFIQGQQKKLPVLLIINGELTKRSKEMLNKEFKGIKIHKLD